jgi:hypothetical protein
MARQRKINLESEVNEMAVKDLDNGYGELVIETYGSVKQMIRRISKGNITDLASGTDSIADVDIELDLWYQKGYVLKQAIYIGDEPESYNVMYVLAKA